MKQFSVSTCMGKAERHELQFLSDAEFEEFNSIGYSGRTLDGKKTTWLRFLNSLGKGKFCITQTRFDDGSFCSEYVISFDEKRKKDSFLSEKDLQKLFQLVSKVERNRHFIGDGFTVGTAAMVFRLSLEFNHEKILKAIREHSKK